MTNIDVKVRLIMRLNSKLKRLAICILQNRDAPKQLQPRINEVSVKKQTLERVLHNLGYLNY